MNSIYGIERQPTFECYRAMGEVLHNKNFILGTPVSTLERKLASYVGMKFGVAVSSGTDAQFLLMKALGIGPGDLVFVPDFTFLSTATTVKMVGATPIFVDVNLDTFTMNPLSLEDKIKKASMVGTPKAVVPVDLFGCPFNYIEIFKVASGYNLIVIEDGCHALGSIVKDLKALSLGDHSFTSFYPTKPLGCFGDAGMIFTNDSDLSSKLRYTRSVK
jgi:dTDP-4-amino-4,6-dideoxygalactose transaminase